MNDNAAFKALGNAVNEIDLGVPAMPLAITQANTKRQSCRALRCNLFAQRTKATLQKGFPLQSLTQKLTFDGKFLIAA